MNHGSTLYPSLVEPGELVDYSDGESFVDKHMNVEIKQCFSRVLRRIGISIAKVLEDGEYCDTDY